MSRVHARQSLRHQRGNALLFGLLALVITGVVIAVGIGAYTDSEKSASVQAVTGQVVQVIGNAKQNYGQYGYAGLTTAIAVGARVIPQSTHVSATAANNKYSGAITLVDNSGTTPGTALLSYANVPADECTGIVNGTQTLARQMTVGGTEVKPLDGTINLATLNTQCTSAANVAITWTIART